MPHSAAALLMLPSLPIAVSNANSGGSALDPPSPSRKAQFGWIRTLNICKIFHIEQVFHG
jgi:hypothetical protein